MPAIAFAAFNSVLLCAAMWDVLRYRIPNLLPALLALSALILAFPTTVGEGLSRAGSTTLIALLGGAMWLRGLLGGGDLKLLVACGLWIPLEGLPLFGAALGLISGVQGLATLAFTRLAGHEPLASAMRSRLPYAVSIAAAGLTWSLLR